MWHIACTYANGDRERYSASTYIAVSAHVARLLAHGRKSYGAKINKINISCGHQPRERKAAAQ